jgi:hypothetical protein
VKFSIRIILPLLYNDKTRIERSLFLKTKEELHDTFGGKTELVPTTGSWKDEMGRLNEEPSAGFEVIADKTNETIRFLKNYKKKLKTRFKQDDIMITYYPVNVI